MSGNTPPASKRRCRIISPEAIASTSQTPTVPKSHHDLINGVGLLPGSTPNWTINVSDIRTVKVCNVSSSATKKDISEFFSSYGDIQFIEFQRDSETTKLAYVTFKEAQGAHTVMLMSGATIVDRPVSVTPAENYQLPPCAPLPTMGATIVDRPVSVTPAENYQLPPCAPLPTMRSNPPTLQLFPLTAQPTAAPRIPAPMIPPNPDDLLLQAQQWFNEFSPLQAVAFLRSLPPNIARDLYVSLCRFRDARLRPNTALDLTLSLRPPGPTSS